MAMSKEMKLGLGVGAAALLGWMVFGGKKEKAHGKAYYVPGDEIVVFQGAPFELRLPRGEYQSLNPELQIASQADYGNVTHVELLAVAAPADYSVSGALANVDNPSKVHHFAVNARRPV